MKLQDKNTIVTGGASGFGAGIVARFLEEGANVTIVDFDQTAALAYMQSLKLKNCRQERQSKFHEHLVLGKRATTSLTRLTTRVILIV